MAAGPLDALRGEIYALYFATSDRRRAAADACLRSAVRGAAACQLCLELLAGPGAQPHEQVFAAGALRRAARKSRDLADAALPLVPQLVRLTLAAAAAAAWPVANLLASAVGSLAVRSPALPAAQLVPQLLALAEGAAAEAGGGQAGHPARQEQQCAVLKLLAVLPEACSSLEVSMHPARREAVRAALAAAPEVAPLLQAAAGGGAGLDGAGAGTAALAEATMHTLRAWAAAGSVPRGLHGMSRLLDQLHAWLVVPALSSSAAETLAALYCACCASPTAVGGEGGQLLLPQLLQRLRPAADGLAAAAAAAAGTGSAAALGHGRQLLFSALAVLSAAGRALDAASAAERAREQHASAGAGAGGGIGGGGAAALEDAGGYVCDCLLQLLASEDAELAIASLELWDERLETWRAAEAPGGGGTSSRPSPPAGAPSPAQREQLGQLLQALMARMALPPDVGAVATADARDLPEQAQAVRRELADTFRCAADVVGPEAVVAQLLALAEAQAAATGAGSPWALEVILYSLNLVWGRQRAVPRGAARRTAALAAAALGAGAPPKLAGTACTLAGGIPAHLLLLLEEQEQEGHRVATHGLLESLLRILERPAAEQGDGTLARCAATCCWRLCSHPGLAAALARRHGGWAAHLCGTFAGGGGLRERAGRGDDVSTSEFLLRAACLLAGAAADGGAALLQRLLAQPLAALEAALDGLAASGAPFSSTVLAVEQQQQQQQHMEQQQQHMEQAVQAAAIQLDALSAMLALLAAPGSLAAPHLPGLLQPALPLLARVTCAAHEGPLADAYCSLGAALARVDAGVALRVLRPLCHEPREPCVLTALQAVVEHAAQQQRMEECQGEQTAALRDAARGCLAAAAAGGRAADPDWAAPALRLGGAVARCLDPALAEHASLQALLAVLESGLRSYHRDVCDAALACAAVLCCAGAGAEAGACRGCGGACGDSGPRAGACEQPRQLTLRQALKGACPSLVLGMLLAAAGAMPPYMVGPIAETLHGIWRQAGTERFVPWLHAAALERAPAEAPWRGWKPAALATALAELSGEECRADGRLFKKRLKALCGGKKKGVAVPAPARA
eukprot:scaffold6.g2744.t1